MATIKTLSTQKWRMWRQGSFWLDNAALTGVTGINKYQKFAYFIVSRLKVGKASGHFECSLTLIGVYEVLVGIASRGNVRVFDQPQGAFDVLPYRLRIAIKMHNSC